jgi:hypothetical protein
MEEQPTRDLRVLRCGTVPPHYGLANKHLGASRRTLVQTSWTTQAAQMQTPRPLSLLLETLALAAVCDSPGPRAFGPWAHEARAIGPRGLRLSQL